MRPPYKQQIVRMSADPRMSTYSIVGADPGSEELGVAVQSKFLGAGAFVPWARAGVGAVATQAHANIAFGNEGLSLLEQGLAPREVLDQILAPDDMTVHRQVGLVTADGRSAAYTGSECFEHAVHVTGPNYSAQGNILTSDEVPSAMAETFEQTEGRLSHRLLNALHAGEDAGGEKRGMESAALLVVKPGGGYGGNHDRMIDLRVDHAEDPIEQLGELLNLHDLYFHRAPEDEWITIDDQLKGELTGLLREAKWVDMDEVDFKDGLFAYLGWENLEERWVDEDHIDPRVLEYMREQLGGDS